MLTTCVTHFQCPISITTSLSNLVSTSTARPLGPNCDWRSWHYIALYRRFENDSWSCNITCANPNCSPFANDGQLYIHLISFTSVLSVSCMAYLDGAPFHSSPVVGKHFGTRISMYICVHTDHHLWVYTTVIRNDDWEQQSTKHWATLTGRVQ